MLGKSAYKYFFSKTNGFSILIRSIFDFKILFFFIPGRRSLGSLYSIVSWKRNLQGGYDSSFSVNFDFFRHWRIRRLHPQRSTRSALRSLLWNSRLKEKRKPEEKLQSAKFGLETGFLGSEAPSKKSLLFLFLSVAGFRIWYQWDPHFWNKIDLLYLIKSGILTCVLGFLYLRSGKIDLKAFLFVVFVLCVLFIHPSQGILNFSYFHIFSFLQADIESKKINVGIKV